MLHIRQTDANPWPAPWSTTIKTMWKPTSSSSQSSSNVSSTSSWRSTKSSSHTLLPCIRKWMWIEMAYLTRTSSETWWWPLVSPLTNQAQTSKLIASKSSCRILTHTRTKRSHLASASSYSPQKSSQCPHRRACSCKCKISSTSSIVVEAVMTWDSRTSPVISSMFRSPSWSISLKRTHRCSPRQLQRRAMHLVLALLPCPIVDHYSNSI